MAQRSNQQLQDALDELEIQKKILELNKQINNEFTGYFNAKKMLLETEQDIADIQQLQDDLVRNGIDINSRDFKNQQRILNNKRKLLDLQKQELKNTSLIAMSYNAIEKSSMALFSGAITNIVKYLLDADKAYKSLNMEIGLSGERSKLLLSNMTGAASYAARMGVSFEELAKIQSVYTDEMGRSVLLTSQSLQDIVDIGKGTKLGVDMAAKLAARFNLMGKSVRSTRDFVEDAVNSAGRYGVSSTAVLSKINENLEKSQGYVFKGGVAGLAKMSEYATKFKVDMNSVFAALDKANSLEGAVDMASQLQVIGGKFAKQDPFKLLHQARTDAAGFTLTMQGLTKGMATYNKTTGEFEIQAGDLNRLKLAADATGMSYEELIKQAKQGAQLDTIGQQLSGSRLSKEAREFVQGVAAIQKDGSFKIQLPDGTMKDIRGITNEQVKALIGSKQSLDQAALNAQSFDEVFKNTIMELKSTLLPILKQINSITKFLADNRSLTYAIAGLGTIMLGVPAIIGTFKPWLKYAQLLKGSSLLGGGGAASTVTSTVGAGGAVGPGSTNPNGPVSSNAAKNMLAFGAAALMVGGAIWLATKGIAAMAESFKELNVEQLSALKTVLLGLGLGIGALAIGMAILAGPLAVAAGPMLAFGGAIALVGLGIGVAAAGIGYMAKGFATMFDSLSKVTDPKILQGLGALILSMSGLGVSAMLFANPLTWIGLKVLSSSIGDITDKLKDAKFDSLAVAGNNFNKIADAIEKINDKKLDKLIAVSQSLSGMGGLVTAIASLKNVFGDSIEVKFKEQKVDLQVNVTNTIDGARLGSVISKFVPLTIEKSRKGSAT